MNNLTKMGSPGWSYRSDGRKRRGNQGTGRIYHSRLNAGMAVGTSGRIRRRLVVMKQAAEQSKNEDRNNGESLDWELSADAPFWMLEPHSVMQRESSTSVIDVHKLRRTSV
jgi:hypothetical protein